MKINKNDKKLINEYLNQLENTKKEKDVLKSVLELQSDELLKLNQETDDKHQLMYNNEKDKIDKKRKELNDKLSEAKKTMQEETRKSQMNNIEKILDKIAKKNDIKIIKVENNNESSKTANDDKLEKRKLQMMIS